MGTKRVAALARGLTVLKAIHARPGASLGELHERTGFPKATLLRSLRTLEDSGFVARRLADGGYLPAFLASEAPRAAPRWLALTGAAGPTLEALGRTIPWPTDLGVRDGATMLILESNRRLASIRSIHVNRQALGFRPHMLWSAMGRAYLAYCPAAEREHILAVLRGSDTPADRAARNRGWVDTLLRETRGRGYGIRDERHAGLDVGLPHQVSAIAVPVRRRDAVLACLNCVWLIEAVPEREIVERHLAALQEAAAQIASRVSGRHRVPRAS